MPLADRSVNAIIANCVFNPAPDKDRVFAEAHRILNAGGRLMIADLARSPDAESNRGGRGRISPAAHLPIQNLAKIALSRSSVASSPVIRPNSEIAPARPMQMKSAGNPSRRARSDPDSSNSA